MEVVSGVPKIIEPESFKSDVKLPLPLLASGPSICHPDAPGNIRTLKLMPAAAEVGIRRAAINSANTYRVALWVMTDWILGLALPYSACPLQPLLQACVVEVRSV